MIAAFYNRYIYLRVATGLILTLLIGFKIAAPVFGSLRVMNKQVSTVTDTDSDKKAENDTALEKEKEFASIYVHDLSHTIWHVVVVHSTAYHINYRSSYHSKITIPPPDVNLHTTS